MLRELGLGISPILAFLLVVLTPVGTGQGVHRDQLLDPVFPHFHFLGAAAVRASLVQRPDQRHSDGVPQGPALGASAGAVEPILSLGLPPVVPGRAVPMPFDGPLWHAMSLDAPPLGRPPDAPPDPPPIVR